MKNNERGFHLIAIMIVSISIGVIISVGWLFWNNFIHKNAVSDTKTSQVNKLPSKVECRPPATSYCSFKKDDNIILAKHIYRKDSISLDSSGITSNNEPSYDPYKITYSQGDLDKISDYLAKEYPGVDLLIEPMDASPHLSYSFRQLIKGVTVISAVIGATVSDEKNVTFTHSTDPWIKSDLMSNIQEYGPKIDTTGLISETKLLEILNSALSKLDNQQKDDIFADRGKSKTPRLDFTYSLAWWDDYSKLTYDIHVNSSTMSVDAHSGKILSENWTTGIKS
jgi:hypothetical protein